MNNHHQDNILSNRNLYVGASDLSAIFNISKYKTQFELAKDKILDGTSSDTSNEYTKYGQLMEAKIREYVNEELYTNFVEDSKTIEELLQSLFTWIFYLFHLCFLLLFLI